MGKARRIAAAIRETGEYRWVGIYDAAEMVAWSGVPAPGHPRFVAGGLVVQHDASRALSPEDRACLEACAGLVTTLFG